MIDIEKIEPYTTFGDGEVDFDTDEAIAYLLLKNILCTNSFWFKDEWPDDAKTKTGLFVNSSDIFVWGCADGDEIDHKEIRELYDLVKEHEDGDIIWLCKKRGEMPQAPVVKSIEKDGYWDLSKYNLKPNQYDEYCKKRNLIR